jgi:ribonucleotide monophosphatase NagD (HAD superfamily)
VTLAHYKQQSLVGAHVRTCPHGLTRLLRSRRAIFWASRYDRSCLCQSQSSRYTFKLAFDLVLLFTYGVEEQCSTRDMHIEWAIATTGNQEQTRRLVKSLSFPAETPVVTGDDVIRGKPSPDVFVLAAERLGVPIEDCIVTGDSIWDILAAA